MKIKFLTLLLIFVLTSILFAGEISIEQAKFIAQKVYYEKMNRKSDLVFESISIADEFTITGEEAPLIYIFNMNNNDGFVIIAAEDNVYPVLGYCFHGKYGEKEPPPAFTEMMDSFKKQIDVARQFNLEANESIKTSWKYYRSELINLKKNVPVVEPLITSLWDQDRYYNKLCPEDPAGVDGHARVGCVATAMAQIMLYHKYPEKGFGSHSYNYSYYGTISANFGEATYYWDEMGDWLTDYNEEVAEICFHCGVAVEMMYGPEGSGAYSDDVPNALKSYFNYAPTTHMERKSFYTTTDWENLLKSELDEFRPMYVSGHGSGGHAFVCDGYDDSNLFHFNWGWGGLYNGYYHISNLHPGTHEYSYYQAAVVGIQSPLPPAADFSANTTTVITGGAVDFVDNSSGIPSSWLWEFGGATPATSQEKNPTGIVYETPGSYQVSLSVSNAMGSDSKTVTDFITVSGSAMPVADFKISITCPAVGQDVVCEDLSLNNPFAWHWQFEPGTVTFGNGTDEHSQNPIVKFDEPLTYSVTLRATNSNGEDAVTRSNHITAGGYPLPFTEDFELGTFKEKWIIENPDGGITWDGYYKVSGNLPSRRAAWINFFAYESPGERDRLISPNINLFQVNHPTLSFKHAYAIYNSTRKDSLILYISTNNGSDWERIFTRGEDGSGNFATHAPITDEFIPRHREDWCGSGFGSSPVSIDLSPWKGNPDVRIMFESFNGHGNSLYIDDFAVIGKAAPSVVQPIPDVSYLEDHTPQTVISDLNSVFHDPDTANSLSFEVASDNEKISPIIYQNKLLISFFRDFYGSGNIVVTATNQDWLSVSDTFRVTILPMNDPPRLSLPDSLVMRPDSISILNIWSHVHDKDNPDSLLNFEFTASHQSLTMDYDAHTGDLSLFSPAHFEKGFLYVQVSDDSNATAYDSLKIRMETESSIAADEPIVPNNYEFYQNYPNPFNAVTYFRFALPQRGQVKLEIFNAIGQKVMTLIDDVRQAGRHEMEFNAGDLPSGVYLVRIQAGSFLGVKKFLLMK